VSKNPSHQYGQVVLAMSCVTLGVVFLIGGLLDYWTNHFDYWIMDHLIGQNFTQFFLGLLPIFIFIFCVNRSR
jgi:zinc transporter ZupT